MERGWYVMTSGGFTLRASQSLADWLGCRRIDLLGHKWVHFVPKCQRALIHARANLFQIGQVPAGPQPGHYQRKDGLILPVMTRYLRSESSTGAVRHIIAHVTKVGAPIPSCEYSGSQGRGNNGHGTRREVV